MTEDKMVGWHHQFNGHEFEQAPGASEGQGSLVCCSPWGHKEQLNNNNSPICLFFLFYFIFKLYITVLVIFHFSSLT